MTWEPYGPTTPEELATFIKARGGMTQGWTGSFDKLEGYAASHWYRQALHGCHRNNFRISSLLVSRDAAERLA